MFPAVDVRQSGTRKEELLLTPSELAAYQQLREPKQLQILPGNHYVAYEDGQQEAARAQAEFLVRHLGV